MFNLDKNNLSTIFVLVYMLIAPILVRYGYDIDQEVFVSAMVAIVGLLGALFSANNPNTMKVFGNAKAPIDSEEPVLNPEYECDDDGC